MADAASSDAVQAWMLVGLVQDAVNRVQRRAEREPFWECAADGLRWVVHCPRAVLWEKLDGTWKPITARVNGRPEPPEIGPPLPPMRRAFERRFPSWMPLEEPGPAARWLALDGETEALVVPMSCTDGTRAAWAMTRNEGTLDPHTFQSCLATYAAQISLLRQAIRGAEARARAEQLSELVDELSLARDAALAASRAKSSFLAHMSHELRTPLNAILGYTELVMEDPQLEGQHHLLQDLERVQGAGTHLLQLISDVLDLARIEAGRMEIRSEPFELACLIREVSGLAAPLVARHGNALSIATPPGSITLDADRIRIKQILMNLLSNAAKFTEGGTVRLGTEVVGSHVRFEVADDGCGMDAATAARVLRPFEQGQNPNHVQGTGLGLSISRELAHRMGGTLTLTSRPGVGTTVRLELPGA